MARNDIHQLNRKFAQMEKQLLNLQAPNKLVGILLERSVRRNFRAGGRPRKWPISLRVLSGHKTLIKTRRLMLSVHAHAMKNKLTLSTNVPYARIHQEGFDGIVNVAARSSLKTKRTRSAFSYDLHMPKRKFLMWQDEDIRPIERIYTRHIMKPFTSTA